MRIHFALRSAAVAVFAASFQFRELNFPHSPLHHPLLTFSLFRCCPLLAQLHLLYTFFFSYSFLALFWLRFLSLSLSLNTLSFALASGHCVLSLSLSLSLFLSSCLDKFIKRNCLNKMQCIKCKHTRTLRLHSHTHTHAHGERRARCCLALSYRLLSHCLLSQQNKINCELKLTRIKRTRRRRTTKKTRTQKKKLFLSFFFFCYLFFSFAFSLPF